jgi:hypothetical protein
LTCDFSFSFSFLPVLDNKETEDTRPEKEAQNEEEKTDDELSRSPTAWEKKVQARQEYRKKLADDPAFVPHLGEFWGHDDRFMDDGLKNDFIRRRNQLPSVPKSVMKTPTNVYISLKTLTFFLMQR